MAGSLSTGDGSGTSPVVAFAGGGTAGHVFPGLAIAARLGRRVVWIGSSRGVERQLVTDAGVQFHGIPAGKLRRYFSLRNVTDILKTAAGVLASLRILRRDKPALLFSKGGFVSVPPVLAAWLRGIPAWTHESDFDPGLATRINCRFCEKVLVSFPETLDFLPESFRAKAVVTGNPVREAVYAAQPARGRAFVGCRAGIPMLLAMGGSLGSSFVNSLVAASLPRLLPRFFVVHQLGEKDFTPDLIAARENYFPAAFFRDELPDLMAAADLVISRAGANSLAEIASLGKPSILIPLPASGSRGDQLRNAAVFQSRGASIVMEEDRATPEALVSTVLSLFDGPGRRETMGRCASTLGGGRPDEAIAELILQRIG
jgi:UDP-N-acetylglucosamine--N-acetylmuramyl-(pentapeptide) pyrophosphoryl-undecaprenol N-acetylglucosamine transferase